MPGELKIARITYPDTLLSDVVRFRGRRGRQGIAFRAVDDNAAEIEPGQRTGKPLTMSRLVRLIERSGEGLGLWVSQLRPDDDPNDLGLSSVFYAESERYYREHVTRWLRRRFG